MNTDDNGEDQLASRLVAYDEALAAGDTPDLPDTPIIPLELHGRLDRDLDCVRLLHEVRPRARAAGSSDTDHGVAVSSPSTVFTSGHVLGRFQLRRELGRGGFGVVFLAYDPILGREVALKVPRLEGLISPELRERFHQEARAAAGLEHPNIVPVYEAGEVGPICYIAAAYCPGLTLAAWLKERADPVPFTAAAELTADLADAVQHAHTRGVVHRDLKPSNVMVGVRPSAVGNQPEGDQLESNSGPTADSRQPIAVKITDFGLAKLMDAEGTGPYTRTGAVLGTPSYMAPEQAGGEKQTLGPGVDIYALGAILYEVLTGRPPFLGEGDVDTLLQVRTLEPVSPRRLRPTLPRDLETICLKCLSKEPRRRYLSAGDLAADLRRFLAKEPIRARPVGLFGRTWRWCRRRPAVAGLLAALLLLGIGSVIGLASLLWLAEDRAKLAERRQSESEESLRRGLRAIDQYFTKISEEELLNVDGMQPLRKKLLDGAVQFYQEFLDQKKDDPRLQEEVALAQHRLAMIKSQMGRSADSLVDIKRSMERLRQLVQDHPEDRNYVRRLAVSYQDLGTFLVQAGRTEEALASYQESQGHLENLLAADAGDRAAQALLAHSYQSVGIVQCGLGQTRPGLFRLEKARQLDEALCQLEGNHKNWLRLALTRQYLGGVLCNNNRLDEATPHLQMALEIQERIARQADSHNARRNLAKTLTALGRVEDKRKNRSAAIDYHERALAITRRLARDNPHIRDHQLAVAEGLNLIGIVHNEAGRPVEAHGYFRQSLDLLQDLVQENRDSPSIQFDLGQTWHNMGFALANLKRPEDALHAYTEAVRHGAIALDATPQSASRRWSLAKHHREISRIQRSLGRHVEAAAAARERAKLYPDDPVQLSETAIALSQCAPLVAKGKQELTAEEQNQRRQYADEAMDYLRQAVARGYKNIKALKEDRQLDAIRARDDFQQLLADMEKK